MALDSFVGEAMADSPYSEMKKKYDYALSLLRESFENDSLWYMGSIWYHKTREFLEDNDNSRIS